ncbi:hypothetical protein WICPIJ_004513 [Wickerhamomyces pijperi]|uniref:Uncharacterized protein n=1 Tax=Wickerhamomyces pijperi TaxID=599730 RepID=A0A9P8Q7U7_WICPI|nr:hypothetical protein WICPIJ_004513 [Wickerhamomyces pijperi]
MTSLLKIKDPEEKIWTNYVLLESQKIIGPDLPSLFARGKFRLLLEILSKRNITTFNAVERAILGLTLIESLQLGPGLREISVACETCPIEHKDLIYVFLLLGFLKSKLNSDVALMMHKIETQNELAGFLEKLTQLKDFKEEFVPLPSEDLDDELADVNSFKSRLIRYKKITDPAIVNDTMFQNIDGLYLAVMDLMPLESAASEFSNQTSFSLTTLYEHSYRLGAENELLISKLFQLKDGTGSEEDEEENRQLLTMVMDMTSLTALVKFVKVETVCQFFTLSQGSLRELDPCRRQFDMLVTLCSRISQIVHRNHFSSSTEDPTSNDAAYIIDTFSYENIRSFMLLSAYTLSQVDPENREHEFQIANIDRMITLIMRQSNSIDTANERLLGRLETYFLVLGNLKYLKLHHMIYSKHEGSITEVDSDIEELIEEIIRMYILVINTKPLDDFGVFPIYDAILTLLSLYGGISMKTIWAFNFFKTFRKLRSSNRESIDARSYTMPRGLLRMVEENRRHVDDLVAVESRLKAAEKSVIFTNKSMKRFSLTPVFDLKWDENADGELKFNWTKRIEKRNQDHDHYKDDKDIGNVLIRFYFSSLKDDLKLNNPEAIEAIRDHLNLKLGLKHIKMVIVIVPTYIADVPPTSRYFHMSESSSSISTCSMHFSAHSWAKSTNNTNPISKNKAPLKTETYLDQKM